MSKNIATKQYESSDTDAPSVVGTHEVGTPPAADHPRKYEAIFEPFQHHHQALNAECGVTLPASAVMRFAGRVIDIANGAKMVAEISEWEKLNDFFREGTDEYLAELPKVFDEGHLGYLERLSAVAVEMLGAEAERLIDWAYKNYTPEGRKENGRG